MSKFGKGYCSNSHIYVLGGYIVSKYGKWSSWSYLKMEVYMQHFVNYTVALPLRGKGETMQQYNKIDVKMSNMVTFFRMQ